jgi:HEAT repeat protein
MSPHGPSNNDQSSGLPPVAPPSGKFIIQLFLVPGLIVTFALILVWGFGWLVGGSYTAEQFLKDLHNPNLEVRWRRASDLAQILPHDKTLASNPTFALHLAELLHQALRENQQSERFWRERSRSRKDALEPDKSLQDERDFIQFLIPCLGYVTFPAGVPLLEEIVLTKEDEGESVELRRRLAVLALANLPENLKYLDEISAEQRQAIMEALENEMATGSPERSRWAVLTMDYVLSRKAGNPKALGVDKTLAECAKANDPILRERVAFALNFWEGTPEENQRMDETLVLLSQDDGRGAHSGESHIRGLEIRYKATEALARRGSEKITKRFGILQEMLDEDKQRQNFRTELRGGQEVADENLVYSTVRGALRGITELHHRQPMLDLTAFYPAIEKLSDSPIRDLRTEAHRTQIELTKE